MTSPDDGRNDAPTLPERDVLDAWEVPMTTPDLTDRILARLDESPALATLPAPRPAVRRGGLGLAVVGIGMVAAAALVLGLVRLWAPEPPAAAPAVVSVAEAVPTVVDATLIVRTTPADATVLIDGRPLPGPSPFSVAGLSAGGHRVVVERSGYLSVERTVEGGVAMELPVELPRRDVVLSLSVDPIEAQVRLWTDDEPTAIGGDGDRYALVRRPGERYEVEATAPGYRPRRVPLAFSGEGSQDVRLTLVRDSSAVGESSTRSEPTRSSPELGSPLRRDEAGDETNRRSSAGSGGGIDSFFPGNDDATLKIGTSTGRPPAKVSVDGKPVGTTPLMRVKVRPGRHRVKFLWADGAAETVTIVVAAGESKVVRDR